MQVKGDKGDILTISSAQIHIGQESSSAEPAGSIAASELGCPVYPVLHVYMNSVRRQCDGTVDVQTAPQCAAVGSTDR